MFNTIISYRPYPQDHFWLCAYQCYAPLPPVWAIVGQGGDLINLHINCPNIRDIPNNQIPLQKVGDYWGFDTRSVTVQYTETVAILKVSSEVIKCPTIGAVSFGQSPYVARLLPVRGVVGHNIDRCITSFTSGWQKRTNIHMLPLVSQATPFAERGRVWSHCNYRVVAEERNYRPLRLGNKMLTSANHVT